jgi:hypothetical protein
MSHLLYPYTHYIKQSAVHECHAVICYWTFLKMNLNFNESRMKRAREVSQPSKKVA